MQKKYTLLNDLYPELDIDFNGIAYDRETEDTSVVYMIYNVMEDKAYVGRTSSYVKNGKQNPYYNSVRGRFLQHWRDSRSNNKHRDGSPIFYEVLRNSDICDWFLFILEVFDNDDDLKESEIKYTRLYDTLNPKYGYNIYVGNNKPENEDLYEKYCAEKRLANRERGKNGELRKTKESEGLPMHISYHKATDKKTDKVSEGYLVQYIVRGKLYRAKFMTSAKTMKEKLALAKDRLETFKRQAQIDEKIRKRKLNKKSGSKSNK